MTHAQATAGHFQNENALTFQLLWLHVQRMVLEYFNFYFL